MSTERNFWTFAFEHPFLTFFAFDILVSGIVTIVRGTTDSLMIKNIKGTTKIVESIKEKLKEYNDENNYFQ